MALSETDLDLLADYAEGLLDGPAATRVAERIASDQEWAVTYQLLTAASPNVDRAIESYAQATPALPAEVAARVERAIQVELLDAVKAPVSLAAVRTRREARRTWLGLSAAAAVIIAVVFGLGSLAINLGGSSKSSTSSEGARPNSAVGTAATEDLAGVVVSSSGADYTKDTLGRQVNKPNAITTFGGPRTPGMQPNAQAVEPQLQRLAVPASLAGCLQVVTAAHGGVPTAVDYARYEGEPALIITLSDPDLRVAVGAGCGLPSSGADELATAPTS